MQAKSVMVVEVTAPAWLHRFIIGKKGQNIGRITQQLPRVRKKTELFEWSLHVKYEEGITWRHVHVA